MPELAVDRRRLIAGAGLAAGTLALPRLAWSATPTDRRLVVVILRGAMDGLSAAPAHGDPTFEAARNGLAIPRPGQDGGALDLDGFFGLNPALKGLAGRFAAKELVLVHAVASPYRDRSHFDAQNLLESGSDKPYGLANGWLNRALGGLPTATAEQGDLPAPIDARPEVPREISTVAVEALTADGGIQAAATIEQILAQASVAGEKTQVLATARVGKAPADPEVPGQSGLRRFVNERPAIVVSIAGIVVIVVLAYLGWHLFTGLAGPVGDTNLGQEAGIGTSEAHTTTTAPPPTSTAPPPQTPVDISRVVEFTSGAEADNPGLAMRVIDPNQSSGWSTSNYNNDFPKFKQGMGLVATLSGPAKVGSVDITSPSVGSVVEVRVSDAAPKRIDDTTVVGSGNLQNGVTNIKIANPQVARYVTIWITHLSPSRNGGFKTEINNLVVKAVP